MAIKCPSCGHAFELTKDPVGFDDFWAAYPRKVGKGQAKRAYILALTKTDKDTLINAAKAYRALMVKRGTDATLQAHPSTFLSGERWLDDELTAATPGKTSSVSTSIAENLHPSWRPFWQKLSSEIGLGQFQSWFLGSSLEVVSGVTIITVDTRLKQDWITKTFARQLWAMFGDFKVVLKPKT